MQLSTHTQYEPLAKAHGHFQILSLETGKVVWQSPVMKNRILNAGLANIIQHHSGATTVPLEITSLELGDGVTAVTGADTALDSLVLAAIPPAKVTPSTTSMVLEFFIVDAELPDGTYTELGMRTGTILHTRSLFTTPYVKVAGRDTIIRYTIGYSAI